MLQDSLIWLAAVNVKCCPVICSITIYRAEDSGPDFSDDEMEYKDVKVC
jgi:hypothetical protein